MNSNVTAEKIKNNLQNIRERKQENLRKNIERSNRIRSIVNELFKQSKYSLNDIKEYLSDKEINTTDSENNIIQAILQCKYRNNKIVFNDNIFNKKLSFYFCGNRLETKILTNDYLYLAMVVNTLVQKEDVLRNFIPFLKIANVKITSDNFTDYGNEKSGFIQDYDPKFSAITLNDLPDSTLQSIITEKPQKLNFNYMGNNYLGFGDESKFFIVPIKMQDDQIIEKYKNMKYLKTEKGKIQLGIKTVPYTSKVYFIDKLITPETFCPAFLITPSSLNLNFLFEMEIDYNDLFELLEEMCANSLSLPENLCYWDTLNCCLDFLCIFGLTANIPKQVKDKIGKYYQSYLNHKSDINKWKNTQLQFQRICMDFLNCFLNDSDYIRFVNLLLKVEKYINEYKDLKTLAEDALNFVVSLPFTLMIQNQMKSETINIIESIRAALTAYVNGKDESPVEELARSAAKKIYAVLPTEGMKTAAFPFIAAPGSLLGTDINMGDFSFNPVKLKISENVKKIKRKKKKDKQEIGKLSSYMDNKEVIIEQYLAKYIDSKFKNELPYKGQQYIMKLITEVKERAETDNTLDKFIKEQAILYNEKKTLPKRVRGDPLYKVLGEINDREAEIEAEDDGFQPSKRKKKLVKGVKKPNKYSRELAGLGIGGKRSRSEEKERGRSRERSREREEEEEE